jgi:hypothetical protein
MGYYVRELKGKGGPPLWKLQFLSYKKEHNRNSTAKKPRKEWDIPKARWMALGFQELMTIDQARSRARQINAQLETKRQEERRKKIEEDSESLRQKFTAAIPDVYKKEFELKYLTGRFQIQSWKKRFLTSWNAAQRMLVEVPLDPMDWYEEAHLFYDYLCKKRFSFSYIKKILVVTNLWGQFLARRLGQPFIRIPFPSGTEKARVLEAYFEKCGNRLNQSDPVTPEQLERVRTQLKPEQYNWLYLSVWLGLRPQEVDQLKDKRLLRLQCDLDGRPILWIYQTKLVSVPPRYRWKLIPIIFQEQKKALEIIKSRKFQRPLVKTVRKRFGRHTTLYGGRKGFTDLMLARQQDFIHISQWMGHSSIERTWRSYKSRRIVHYSVPEDEAA